MGDHEINWDDLPNVITKEQFYQICHVSKATARYLLLSGLVPCINSGKKTRCYLIKKGDVKEYIVQRKQYPQKYLMPNDWCGRKQTANSPRNMVPVILDDMHDYYTEVLKEYKDVLSVQEVSDLTGYCSHTITTWCSKGYIKFISKSHKYHIPKIFLIDFLCSTTSMRIIKRSSWHNSVMGKYSRWISSIKQIEAD